MTRSAFRASQRALTRTFIPQKTTTRVFPMVHTAKSGMQGLGTKASRRLAITLLSGVALSSLVVSGAGQALADDLCLAAGDLVTCTGDQSDGISLIGPVTGLEVRDLAGDIEPGMGAAGIRFDSEGPIAITSDTGPFVIRVSGDNTHGIHASSFGTDADVSVEHAGDIFSNRGSGLLVTAWGDAASASSGVVDALGNGIQVQSLVSGSASVTQQGSILSRQANGVYATAFGSVDVDTTGTITAHEDAIFANSTGEAAAADITINHSGAIESWEGRGIYALSAYGGVVISASADILSLADGIHAEAIGTGENGVVDVGSIGDITSWEGKGIHATSVYRAARVTSVGDITSLYDGIYAASSGGVDGRVDVDQTGRITSYEGNGVYAQSINAGVSVTVSGAIDAKDDGIHARSTGNDAGAGVVVDSQGGIISQTQRGIFAEANWESVAITNVGTITAKGNAIHANATGDRPTSTISIDQQGDLVSYDGRGISAEADNAGISIVNRGNITAKTDGIYARSPGNPVGSMVTIDHEGNILANDNAGIYADSSQGGISVVSVGDIIAKTYGIFVRGTGGESSEDVTISHTGDITAYSGPGIFAESSSNAAFVTLDGAIRGGTVGISADSKTTAVTVDVLGGGVSETSSAGVLMHAITSATLNNHGTIATISGDAVRTSGYGIHTINNYGTISGEIEIAGTDNRLVNMAGGVLNLGSYLEFGPWGTLANAGIVSPGGDGRCWFTDVEGDYVQSSEGTYLIDFDLATGEADRMAVYGTASLSGGLGLVLDDLNFSVPTSTTVLTSGGLLVTDLRLLNGAIDADIAYIDGRDVSLTVNGLDFEAQGLGTNERSVAGALNAEFENATPALAPVFLALANVQGDAAYSDALQTLTPDLIGARDSGSLFASNVFANRMLSCRVADGAYAFGAEGECAWVNTGLTFSENAAADYDQTAFNLAAGAQMALSQDWRLGGAVGFSDINGGTDLGTTTGERFEAGVIVKYDREATLFAASLTGGIGSWESSRTVSVGEFVETIDGSGSDTFLSARLHAAHTLSMGTTYIRPLADLVVTSNHFSDVTETGGVTALDIEASSHLSASIAPALEVGAEFKVSDAVVARPYARAGVSLNSGSPVDLTASFVEGSGADFTIETTSDAVMGTLAAGVDLVTDTNASVRVYYEGGFGSSASQHGFGLKAGAAF